MIYPKKSRKSAYFSLKKVKKEKKEEKRNYFSL